jgi:uridine phosphorylase
MATRRIAKKTPASKSVRRRATARVNRFPILDFDPDRAAVIEPHRLFRKVDVPEHCVLCFFQDVIDDVCRDAREVFRERSEMGTHPIYELDFDGSRIVVAHPRVGAPMSAGMLDGIIAMGCRKFIACGGAGVLDGTLVTGHLIVPTEAIRDEGTSYHYLPGGKPARATPRAVAAIEEVLREHGHDYLLGKTWTTDAYFRETRGKVEKRRKQGCLTVEMEAAAFFAVAEFRGVEFGQILYAGDDLSGEWDPRNWNKHDIRSHLFRLSASACLKL